MPSCPESAVQPSKVKVPYNNHSLEKSLTPVNVHECLPNRSAQISSLTPGGRVGCGLDPLTFLELSSPHLGGCSADAAFAFRDGSSGYCVFGHSGI